MTFATAAARTSAAIMRHLADTSLVINDAATVAAVWREPHAQAFEMLDLAVPTAHIRLADYPGIKRDDRVQRGTGAAYRVIAVEPDGYGLAMLRLELWS
jgi:hypothetical protein